MQQESMKQELFIPINLRFFNEELPPGDPPSEPPPKTYTQDELNTREASTKKAARYEAEKALFGHLGVKDMDEFNASLDIFKSARANAESNKSLADKYEAVNASLSEKDNEIAALNAKLTASERANVLREYGVSGAELAVLTAGISTLMTDEKDFSAAAKEYFEAHPRPKNEKPKPQLAGGGMGNTPAPKGEITKEQFNKMSYAERGKLRTDNPELYKKLST
jgi:hypothetical protein